MTFRAEIKFSHLEEPVIVLFPSDADRDFIEWFFKVLTSAAVLVSTENRE